MNTFLEKYKFSVKNTESVYSCVLHKIEKKCVGKVIIAWKFLERLLSSRLPIQHRYFEPFQ